MAVKLDLNNKIINGAMDFWQRGTSFATIANNTYFADRFVYQKTGTMVHTASKSTDVPTTAFGQSSILLTPTTAQASLTAGDFCHISQRIEGTILRTFKDKKMVLTFWVKAAKTGTYCVSFRNSASNRSLVKEYTVSTTNTWEKKTIHLTHDSTGTWVYDTGIGLRVSFAVATGSTFTTSTVNTWLTGEYYASTNQVNGVDNLADTFQITDVCLVEDNEGQTRSPSFTYATRTFMDELDLCHRYYEKSYNHDVAIGTVTDVNCTYIYNNNGTTFTLFPQVPFKQEKRVAPTVTVYNPSTGASGSWQATSPVETYTAALLTALTRHMIVQVTSVVGGRLVRGHFTADAEL